MVRTARACGWAFFATGLFGQLVTFFPPQWQRPEWEVAYFGEFSATIAALVIGLGLLAVVDSAERRRFVPLLSGWMLLVLGVWAGVGAMLVALDLPLLLMAARGAETAQQATGIKIVGFKALALSAVYSIGLITLAWVLLKPAPRSKSTRAPLTGLSK